jgi:hypothetical protein
LKILVTGHPGYIGTLLAPLLQRTARRRAQELYETYRQVGLPLEDFEGPRYMRIDRIRGLLASGPLDTTQRWQAPREALVTQG